MTKMMTVWKCVFLVVVLIVSLCTCLPPIGPTKWEKTLLSPNMNMPPVLSGSVSATLKHPTYGDRLFMYGGETSTGYTSELRVFRYNVIDQWASHAKSSSESCSREGWSGYCALDATGPPDVKYCGKSKAAWLPGKSTTGTDWLYVQFDVPVHATELLIRESLHVGFVRRVELIDQDYNNYVVFSGVDTTVACPHNFVVTLPEATIYKVIAANITIESSDWASIDSVQLIGFKELAQPEKLTFSVDQLDLFMEDGEDVAVGNNTNDMGNMFGKPPALVSAAASFVGTNMYLFGGTLGKGLFSDAMYTYSVQQNQWELVPQQGDLSPGQRGSHLMTAVGNEIFLFGGFNAQQLIDERYRLWVFDITHSAWSLRFRPDGSTDVWPWTRTGSKMVNLPTNNGFTFFGGLTKDRLANDVWIYNTDTLDWTLLFAYNTSCPLDNTCPSPRQDSATDVYTYNNVQYLVVHGGYNPTSGPLNDMWIFNLQTRAWRRIANSANGPAGRSMHVAAVIKKQFVIIGGTTQQGLNDEYHTLDIERAIETGIAEWDTVQVPASREGFVSFFFQDHFYIHGGRNGRTFYSDMWAFDLLSNIWKKITSDTMPTLQCAYHSAVRYSTKMFFFGGLATHGPLNDIYEYDLMGNSWKQIAVTNVRPPPRYNHIVAVYDRSMYIYGGEGNGPLADMWVYSFANQSWEGAGGKFPQLNARRQTGITLGPYLYLFGGHDLKQGPNNEIHSFSLAAEKALRNYDSVVVPTWQTVYSDRRVIAGNTFFTASAGTVVNYYQALLLGGSYPSDPTQVSYSTRTILYDAVTNSTYEYFELSPSRSDSTIQQDANSIYVFGGKSTLGPLNDLWKLTTTQICDPFYVDDYCLQCSPGYKVAQDGDNSYTCVPCAVGHYSSEFHALECQPCPAGFTSEEKIMKGFDQCVPCEYGTVNLNLDGVNICKPCNETNFCPLGSLAELPASLTKEDTQILFPIAEETNGYISNIAVLLSSVVIVVIIGFIIFVFVTIRVVHPTLARKIFKPMDIFSRCHSFRMKTPLILKKTTLGGTFTITFFLTWLLLFLALLIPFLYNNYDETRSLNPAVFGNSKISATVTVAVVLPGYSGECTNESAIYPFAFGWRYAHENTKLLVEKIKKDDRVDCSVQWICHSCSLSLHEAFVSLAFEHDRAYTSIIEWSVSMDSAIPLLDKKRNRYISGLAQQKMNVSGIATPFSYNTVFKGDSPTRFKFIMFPTSFQSNRGYAKSVPLTGYQFEYIETEKGSTVDVSNFHQTNNLNILFQFRRSDNFLDIRSTQKTSIQTFLSTLLGASFGLLALFCVVLIGFEDAYSFIHSKVKRFTKNMKDGEDDEDDEDQVNADYILFRGEETELTERLTSSKSKPKNLNAYIRNEVKKGGFKKADNFDLRILDPEFYTQEKLAQVSNRRKRRRHAIFVPPSPSPFYYTTFEPDSDSDDESSIFTARMNREVEKLSRTTSMTDRTDVSFSKRNRNDESSIWE